jgi:hypothetical protein
MTADEARALDPGNRVRFNGARFGNDNGNRHEGTVEIVGGSGLSVRYDDGSFLDYAFGECGQMERLRGVQRHPGFAGKSFTLRGTAPVDVELSFDADGAPSVVAVRVLDTEFTYDDRGWTEAGADLSAASVQRLENIADDDLEWPVWKFGD